MRIAWLTDLHLNFVGLREVEILCNAIRESGVDSVLITGDIASSDNLCRYLDFLADNLKNPIYFVLGNHDYYGSSMQRIDFEVGGRTMANQNLIWLSRTDYVIKLTPATCLIGHEGLADGRLGDRFLPHRDRMKAAYAVDGWLCTHAGVSPGIADIIPTEVISAGSQDIAAWLNDEFQREMSVRVPLISDGRPQRYGHGPLFQIDYCRFGSDPFGGIFWFDSIREKTNPSSLVGRQIFGHTPVSLPQIGDHWINLNNQEGGFWVYDTEKDCLVNVGQNSDLVSSSEKM